MDDEGRFGERRFAEHEHIELLAGIDRIHAVAGHVGEITAHDLAFEIGSVINWLERTFEPHVAWEERWLYPELDTFACSEWATRLSRYDHGQIRALAARLPTDRAAVAAGPPPDPTELRAHLFGLEALLRSHLEREEQVLLPLLDAPPRRRQTG